MLDPPAWLSCDMFTGKVLKEVRSEEGKVLWKPAGSSELVAIWDQDGESAPQLGAQHSPEDLSIFSSGIF